MTCSAKGTAMRESAGQEDDEMMDRAQWLWYNLRNECKIIRVIGMSGKDSKLMELVSTATKRCGACREFKPLTLFDKDKKKKDGYNPWCKPCRKDYNQKRYVPDSEVARIKNLKRMYGLTPAEYQSLFIAQNGRCAACNRAETEIDVRTKKIANLAVDHNHTTGKIRGLLCRGCNTALGYLNDSPERIKLLLAYAEIHSDKEDKL